MRSRLQAVLTAKDLQPSIKKWKFDYDYYSVPLLLVLNKWEAHMQTVGNSYTVHLIWCKYPQIKADSLQLKHILFVSFEIHCGGV